MSGSGAVGSAPALGAGGRWFKSSLPDHFLIFKEVTLIQKGLKERVLKELETIRLYLVSDGGDIDFVSLKGAHLKLKFKGNCVSCPMSNLTFKMGIEREIKDKIPEITEIEMVV